MKHLIHLNGVLLTFSTFWAFQIHPVDLTSGSRHFAPADDGPIVYDMDSLKMHLETMKIN